MLSLFCSLMAIQPLVSRAPIADSLLADQIKATIQPYLDGGGQIGIHIGSLDGNILYTRDANTRFIPASNHKLISAAFAFKTLGADHRLETRFWREPNGIYIDAQGDQTLSIEQLRTAATELKISGKETVYLKQAYDLESGPGWESDDLSFRYAPRLQAFSVNRAQFEVISRDRRITIPAWTKVKVSYGHWLSPFSIEYDRKHQRLHIAGIASADGLVARFALPEPAASASSFFGRKMIRVSSVPHRTPDLVIRGPKLADWVKMCLPLSDNLLAENMLIQATLARNPGKPFTYSLAQEAVAEFAREIALPTHALRLDDGSGLSRHNLVTTNALAHILRYSSTQPYWNDLLTALPTPGEGTLSTRLNGVRISGKTGTMDHVSCLSGVLWTRSNKPLIVVVMMNNYSITGTEAKQLQDSLIHAILQTTTDF